MKKLFVVLVLLAFTVGGAFAINLSAGVGASIQAYSNTLSDSASSGGVTASASNTINYTPLGVSAFFDATYLQAAIGYEVANGGSSTVSGTGVTTTTSSLNQNLSYLLFSAYGKYPFKLGPVSLFPLLGITYLLNLTYTDSSGNNLKSGLTSQEQADLNQLWIRGGVGADFSLGQKLYLRPELLTGFKILSSTDNDTVTGVKNALTGLGLSNVSASMGYWSWDLSLMLGYKL